MKRSILIYEVFFTVSERKLEEKNSNSGKKTDHEESLS